MYDGRYTINTWPKHQKATLDKMSTAERIGADVVRPLGFSAAEMEIIRRHEAESDEADDC
jgi:hypothetical protein